jgi:hypothetical protein
VPQATHVSCVKIDSKIDKINTFLHLVMEGGGELMPTSRHSDCQPAKSVWLPYIVLTSNATAAIICFLRALLPQSMCSASSLNSSVNDAVGVGSKPFVMKRSKYDVDALDML